MHYLLCILFFFFFFLSFLFFFFFFFFQAEDGIRDADVTGVQTCALPISSSSTSTSISTSSTLASSRSSRSIVPVTVPFSARRKMSVSTESCSDTGETNLWSNQHVTKIGRASCRERV